MKLYISWDDDEFRMYTSQSSKIQKQQANYCFTYVKGRTNVAMGGLSDKRSDSLPQDLAPNDNRFDVPFDISRNGELLISSIYKNSFNLPPSKKFALVDIRRKQIRRIFATDYVVKSLAWSPNGNYFAVLFSENVTKQTLKRFGPLNLFADFLGHPISYYTFYLAIYDAAGALLCTERIIETVSGSGYIDWGK